MKEGPRTNKKHLHIIRHVTPEVPPIIQSSFAPRSSWLRRCHWVLRGKLAGTHLLSKFRHRIRHVSRKVPPLVRPTVVVAPRPSSFLVRRGSVPLSVSVIGTYSFRASACFVETWRDPLFVLPSFVTAIATNPNPMQSSPSIVQVE